MKKFFSLLTLPLIFSIFIHTIQVKAQDACSAKLLIHYHRHDNSYEDYEAYTWDNGTNISNVAFTDTDLFGGVATIPVCSDAADEIDLILKEKGTDNFDYKDGIDANQDGDIDNKVIDVSDIVGLNKTKEVFIIQGSNYVYYQNPLADTYFGKSGFGNVVVVYYNPTGNEGWDDLWTWDTGTDAKSNDITFDYKLGIDQNSDPDLFNVAVINIANDADDQIGFVVRRDSSWDVKDTYLAKDLTTQETDELGHTYTPSGDRFINVTDVKGAGYKFIYVINGVKTLYQDYNQFISDAFKLEFTHAEFQEMNTLSVTFNQAISYEQNGPDITKFQITDQNGKVVPIESITYNSLATSANTFNIVIKDKIESDSNYTITYNYDQLDEQKSTSMQTKFANGLFQEETVKDTEPNPVNYNSYIIAGIIVFAVAGAGVALLYKSRR